MLETKLGRAGMAVDLNPLSGDEVKEVARILVSGHLETVLRNKDLIAGLDARQIQSLVEMAGTRANCGGFGCG